MTWFTTIMNFRLDRTLSFVITTLFTTITISPLVSAEPVYHPSGSSLTFGGMTHRQLTVSDMGNPAQPAIDPTPHDDANRYGVGFSIGLGIEYDANDNFFDLLNQAGNEDALTTGGGSSSDGSGQSSTNTLSDIIGNVSGDATPEQDADLQALVDEVAVEAASLATFVGLATTGLNAKAFASADIPILISRDSTSAWTFGANASLTTNIRGLSDPITFNSTTAKDSLEEVYTLDSSDPATTYDLSGGASITVDPSTGETNYAFENNSGTVTRAAQITEISLGYSQQVWQQDDNKIYLGIKPKYYDVGLSNSFVFISNISDAKSIFEALDSSNFKYNQEFSVDFGATWTNKQYQAGATVTNINEPSFTFPDIDLSSITNPDIIDAILAAQTYTMERQLKLDAGFITPSGAWGVNVGLDVNAVPDPMGDDYQWLSFGAGFASDNWWLPGARVGVRTNLAGSKLTYITGGVTLFNVLNVDVATTTDTVKVDGTTVPRGFILNIGAKVLF